MRALAIEGLLTLMQRARALRCAYYRRIWMEIEIESVVQKNPNI
jgi:hypothetical protein